jgi:hypothetical protein
MKKTLLLCGALIALSASAALAAGINLSYNDCGTFGLASKSFACNNNTATGTGLNTVVASFVAPSGVDHYVSCESELEIQTDSPTLPDWWKIRGTGQCRTGVLLSNADFTAGPFNCTDFFSGAAAGGIGAYDLAFGGLNRSHIKLVWAVAPDAEGALIDGTEYYAFKISFNNSKSFGTGSCAGCAIPACINMRYIKVVQPSVYLDNRTISNPADRAHVTWQAAGDPICIGATPSKNSTWGAVKALYR